MSKFLIQSIKAFALVGLLAVTQANAQVKHAPVAAGDFIYTLANDVQVSDKVLEFDLFLLDDDASQPFEMAAVQAGIIVNPAIYNGGTITVSIIAGTSGFSNSAQYPTSVIWTLAQNTIKLTAKPNPGSGNGSIISTVAPGTRICRLRITNTVPFAVNNQATLTFSYTSSPYQTKVSEYIAGVSTVFNSSAANTYSNAANRVLNIANWDGSASSDWNAGANWSSDFVPSAAVNVTVPSVTTMPVVNESTATPAVCNNLTINSGASLTVAGGKALTVSGTLTNNAGSAGLVVNSGGSLIENTPGVFATVNRDMPANNWHLISSPISDAVSAMFVGHYLQWHNEFDDVYTDILYNNILLSPMKGYAVWGDASGFTASYAGTLNTGNKSYNVTKLGAGWNLVGNPYPCSIDWNNVAWTKTNVNAAISMHVNNATWAQYSLGSGGTNGGSQYIAPGQGFFVQASAAGTLAVTDAAKLHSATAFFKNSAEVVNNLVRLQVSGNGYTDEALLHFMPEATAEFDGQYDAAKLYGDVAEAAQIYTLGSTPMAINVLPEASTVALGVKAGASGIYTIAATEINDLAIVTLEDTKTAVFADLKSGSYSFNFVAGENENRFVLHFGTLSVGETEIASANIYSFGKTVHVNMNAGVMGDIYIYNISGQLVASKASAQGTTQIGVPVTGNYIVKVISRNNTVVRKVSVQ
jgi:hypothetical protein